MQKQKSNIPFDYVTLKTTQGRIAKGLLAIPVSLIEIFPKQKSKIVVVDGDEIIEEKKFTPYTSTSHECRIMGMKNFYAKYNIKDGDELVIQILDDNKFKIIPEKIFEILVLDLESKLEKTTEDNETEEFLNELSKVTNKTSDEVLKSEFIRLSNQKIPERKVVTKPKLIVKESVPSSLKKILLELYKGKCQISGFTFLRKTNSPYFEIHHIDSSKGNHLKNLLVVSPNVHAQFTYALIEQFFDEENWLRKVTFNDESHSVFQIVDTLPKIFEKEIHYI